eukprot:snap_masked-scaffold2521_size14880-processed-gene-0.0 protein:Tk01360 transcript:snap_masked-scaffold2521_size14880-processed-gene-0.0-mRNA-1 annotation:"histidine kinase"
MVLAGLLAVLAIGFLVSNVARELKALQYAQSDTQEWSLAQTEVEFLEFLNAVTAFAPPPEQVKTRFDLLYSRIDTIEQAPIYQIMRDDPQFMVSLIQVRLFLNTAAPIVDLPEPAFINQQSSLAALATQIRPTIRALSSKGAALLAHQADRQRNALAFTVVQLAVSSLIFIAALGTSIAYLVRLNGQNIQRQKAQTEIATRMNTVIDTSLDGIIVSDDAGIVIEFSKAAEAIFGYSATEAVGRDLGDLIVPDKHRRAHDAGMTRMQNGGVYRVVGSGRMRIDAMRKDKSIFPVELSIQTAALNARRIYIAFLRDVSSVVAAEQDLVKARDAALAGEQLKTDFLATMSHEIRTPLNGLLGNMSLMQDTTLCAKQTRYMRNMETSGRLLMRHISNVLDITRYDAGKLPINLVPMNVSILVQDIIDTQAAMAEVSSTRLQWAWVGPKRDWVLSDPDRVQLVLINLISNAVKFTRDGDVRVTAELMTDPNYANHIRFRVKDTGPGMTRELANRIFDDFVTGNAAYDRDVGGTGLGLGIAKRFVAALGGTISVTTQLGEGSLFDVILPMPQADAPAPPAIPAAAVICDTALTVLIVDDNDINRIVAREMLEAAGHRVTEAANGKAAVKLAADTRFDVIFMDISMPEMDGRTAARHLREGDGHSKNTPIVALTAHALPEDQDSFAADGMAATLTKPLTRHSLLAALRLANVPTNDISQDKDALYRSKTYAKLQARFIAETDRFVAWAQTSGLSLADLGEEAHKAAGSAATFQAIGLSNVLQTITAGARTGDTNAVGAALKRLPTVWQNTKSDMTSCDA